MDEIEKVTTKFPSKKVNRTFIIFIAFLIFIIIIESIISIYLYAKPQTKVIEIIDEDIVYYSDKTVADFEYEEISKVAKKPKNINDVFVTGWIPDWDIADGFNSVKNREGTFDGFSIFWLLPQEDGSLKEVKNNLNPEIISYAKSKKIELIATLPLFDSRVLNKILNNPESYRRHIDQILQKVDQYDYDGIDLDYESIYLFDKKLFFQFLTELAEKLHSKNKKLVFTVSTKFGDEFQIIEYPSFIQTKMVQDYKKISDIVDEMRIMTYEFTDRSSAKAGPIGPLKWVEHIIKYAIYAGVPREKLVIGVHNYMYDWSDRNLANDDLNLLKWYSEIKVDSSLPRATAFYHKELAKIKQNYEYTEAFNEPWGEMVMKYNSKGQTRIIVYMNNKSIQMRKQLAADYGIKGVAYWRLGDEEGLAL